MKCLQLMLPDMGAWWWLVILVFIAIAFCWPPILLLAVLLVWRAGELCMLSNMLKPSPESR
jgi:hypothetical protein